jgi:hypothetical protein
MSGTSTPERTVTIMTLQMCEEAAMAAIALQATRHRPEAQQAQATTLKPLDPDVVSASIPAFFIGRNKAGLWVARSTNGRIGGLFLFKSSAVDFANHQSEPARCALVFPTESFELDVENRGNPLIVPAARLLEGAKQLAARLTKRQQT